MKTFSTYGQALVEIHKIIDRGHQYTIKLNSQTKRYYLEEYIPDIKDKSLLDADWIEYVEQMSGIRKNQ